MNPTQFQSAALEIVGNYWRIKAANALYRSSELIATGRLEYANVPKIGVATHNLQSESIADAVKTLQQYVAERLPRDLFFALIAEFESRINSRLGTLGDTTGGTLGSVQNRIQARVALPHALIDDMNEIRERRNDMIHNGDVATAKYIDASNKVRPRAGALLNVTAIGDNVCPTAIYLTYAADVLIRYSNAIG